MLIWVLTWYSCEFLFFSCKVTQKSRFSLRLLKKLFWISTKSFFLLDVLVFVCALGDFPASFTSVLRQIARYLPHHGSKTDSKTHPKSSHDKFKTVSKSTWNSATSLPSHRPSPQKFYCPFFPRSWQGEAVRRHPSPSSRNGRAPVASPPCRPFQNRTRSSGMKCQIPRIGTMPCYLRSMEVKISGKSPKANTKTNTSNEDWLL